MSRMVDVYGGAVAGGVAEGTVSLQVQVQRPRRLSWGSWVRDAAGMVWAGLKCFAFGLFCDVVCGRWVNPLIKLSLAGLVLALYRRVEDSEYYAAGSWVGMLFGRVSGFAELFLPTFYVARVRSCAGVIHRAWYVGLLFCIGVSGVPLGPYMLGGVSPGCDACSVSPSLF